MTRLAAALALVCTLTGSAVAQPQPAAAPAKRPDAALDAFIAQGMKDWKIPGLSIVVVKDGTTVFEKGFGVRRLDAPGAVDAQTLFGMMSTTKAMTALAVAMLVDEGKVKWDDPVTKHLPWLQLPEPYLTAHVTVRDALRHSTGLANADLLWGREDMPTREIFERLRFVPTTDSLRSHFLYHNVMYQAAGEVVAAASGMPWERFVATRILAPLRMMRSYPTYDNVMALKDANTSIPHFEIDDTVRVIEDVTVDRVPAAGAAWSTAHDMASWLRFLLNGGEVNGKRLVSEAGFRELLKPQVVTPPNYPTATLVGSHWTTYGLGWFQQDYRGMFVAMHTGSMDGRTAMAGLVPDQKLGVYIFGNLDHAEFRHALLWKVIDLWTGAPNRDWNAECLKLYGGLRVQAKKSAADREAKRVKDTTPSHALDAYEGTYEHPTWGRVWVNLEHRALTFRMGPSPRNAGVLEHWNYDTFRVRMGDGRSGWSYVGFNTGPDGAIVSLVADDPTLVFVRVPRAGAGSR
jgi:CubicO group peptidase (beta-lactamase class C family)